MAVNQRCMGVGYISSLTTQSIRWFYVTNTKGGAEQWDKAVVEANNEYRTRMHNIFCDNCHSHVAYALNSMEIRAFGINNWDMQCEERDLICTDNVVVKAVRKWHYSLYP
eukprot:scaffold436_cov188-Alexandrium_tamarense.AAC.20